MTTTETKSSGRSTISQLTWPLVIAAGLAISWWSLYTLAHTKYGMPTGFAVVVSTVYDGGALVLADLSQRYARSTDSGFGPRFLMLTLIGASAWLNYEHAVMLGYSLPGKVMFASPPVVAGALFEIEQRFTHREALRAHGRVAPALPAFGRWAWAFHPFKTIGKINRISRSRLESVPDNIMDIRTAPAAVPALPLEPAGPMQLEQPEPVAAILPAQQQPADLPDASDADLLLSSEPPAWSGMTVQAAVERADAILPGRSGREIAEVLGKVGITTTDSYVRTARRRIEQQHAAREIEQQHQDAQVIPIQSAYGA